MCVSLGILEGTLMLANVRHCLCLAFSNLFGATGNPQFVASSAVLGCTWEGASCAPKSTFPSITPCAGQQKSQDTSRFTSTCPQPVGCLLGSVTVRDFGGVGRIGFSGSPVRWKCWSGFRKGDGCSPCPRATQLSLSWILC